MTAIVKRQRERFYTHKSKKLRNVLTYKTPYTFQKARQFPLRFLYTKIISFKLRDFSWIFEVGIFIQKSWHFTLRDVFIYKKLDTSPKSKTICYTFLYTKIRHFVLRDFSLNFWNLRRGGGIYLFKKMHFAWHFYIEKLRTLRYVAIYKEPDTLRYILIRKKQFTFRYVFVYIIYRVVLIPNYKRTYDQIEK